MKRVIISPNIKYLLYSVALHIIIICAIYFSKTSIDNNKENHVEQSLVIQLVKKDFSEAKAVVKKPIIKKEEKIAKETNILKNPYILKPKKKDNILSKKTDKKKIVKKTPPLKKVITKNKKGLSYREDENIKNQITRCYRKALSENRITNQSVEVLVRISIDKYGFIDPKYNLISLNIPQSNIVLLKRIQKSIKEALSFCSPFRNLPQHKYQIWKNRIIKFENM